MSRRIRSIKPEIVEDEKIGPLSDTAFRLFTSMITISDDFGNVRADPRWLQAQIWWAHPNPPNVLPALIELAKSGLIEPYGVRGGTFAHLKGWAKHQRVDNAGKNRVPTPDDQDSQVVTFDDSQSIDSSPRNSAKFREIPLDGMGEDGKGKEMSGKPDPADPLVLDAYAEINRLAKRNYDPTSEVARDIGKALHRDKRTEADVLRVIRSKADWLDKPEMREHFNPKTLLGRKNFANYLEQSKAKQPSMSLVSALPERDTCWINGVEHEVR